MKDLSTFPREQASGLRGLLFDLDDTLLSHGVLTPGAYTALWSLRDAGLDLVAVTGRPAGWGEVLARQWPISGCVTENGAVHVVRAGAHLAIHEACDDAERRLRRARLAALVERVRVVLPDAQLSDDVGARRSDVTWDIGERRRLPPEAVRIITREIEAAGARWVASSVHLHATYDVDDKASGAIRFCARELGVEPGRALASFAFIGDSANDASCFAAFRATFGVANVRSSVARLSVPPRYVATRVMGEGFAEVAAAILRLRG